MNLLNDYTAQELAIISRAIAQQIEDTNDQIKVAQKFVPDHRLQDVCYKELQSLPVLKAFHVQVLSAHQQKKHQEIVSSN
jgi:hypothetical protein